MGQGDPGLGIGLRVVDLQGEIDRVAIHALVAFLELLAAVKELQVLQRSTVVPSGDGPTHRSDWRSEVAVVVLRRC